MTMYSNQLAVAIKTAGKVLREQKDKVFLPFGSEYSIYIKNLNTVRALVRVDLDGEDVTGDHDLVIQPNGSIDLERFLKNGNLKEGNRFKFIERTGKIEAHRGVGVEDGLIRVEFQFEKVPPKVIEHDIHHYNHHYHDYWDYYRPYKPYWYGSGHIKCASNNIGGAGSALYSCDLSSSGAIGSASGGEAQMRGLVPQSMSFNASAAMTTISGAGDSVATSINFTQSVPVNDAGITVPGSMSNQQFTLVSSFPVEDAKHVIILKLLGETNSGAAVKEAVTVKYKQTCITCGTRNRGANKFCRECGTALELA